jgi:hypothetical protein
MTNKPRDNAPRLNLNPGKRATVELGADSAIAIKKTFDHWMNIGKGARILREEAERIGGRKTFAVLLQANGYAALVDKEDRISGDLSRQLKICEHEAEVRKWRDGLDEDKQYAWAGPSAVMRHCPLFAKPDKKTHARQMPAQPLTEEQLRERSAIKPSAEAMKAKEAANAEAEAKKLGAVEAEADKLRERVHAAEMAKSALESQVEELEQQVANLSAGAKAAAPSAGIPAATKPPLEMKEVSKNSTYRAYVDGKAYYDINLREGTKIDLFGDGSMRDWQQWEITKFVGKVDCPFKPMPASAKEMPEKRKARSEANTKAREQTYVKALAIAQQDYARYK